VTVRLDDEGYERKTALNCHKRGTPRFGIATRTPAASMRLCRREVEL
jgi:hypothetical protein